jgi:predicted nicotinamide N-methyase
MSCAHCGCATQAPCPAGCGLVLFCGKRCKALAWEGHAAACAAARPGGRRAGAAAAGAAPADAPSLGGAFVCREYATRVFSFPRPPPLPPLEVPLDCLSAASTDFDLTGQIVWPVSRLVAQYLASGPGVAELLRGARVLELGAGCGLCGVAAAALGAGEVVLSDNEPEVLAVLEKNAERPAPGGGGCALRVADFSWGDGAAAAALGTFPVLLGADVVYWSHCVEPLFASAAALLAPGGVFVLGFTNRRNGLREAAEAAARAAGFVWQVVDLRSGWLDVEDPAFAAQLGVVTLFRMQKEGL